MSAETLYATPVNDYPRTADIERPEPAGAERAALEARIRKMLKAQDAVLVAHYYVEDALQALAESSGGYVSDSLDMARFGHEHPASTLIVAGVRFMGETAKILNPEKRVLMPQLEATCSLDLGCPADRFAAFCDQHPDRTVVVYANTSAAVKARADWMVTSSCAADIVSHLHAQGQKILWAPDKHLGAYIREQTGADMLLWDGACIVHEEFKGAELEALRREHPQAKVLAHPESPASVVAQADVVGSTSRMVQAVRDMDAQEFIVATCRSCAHCPWMAMNSLQALLHALETGAGEIHVDPAVGERARRPIERMLDFTRRQKLPSAGDA